MSNINAPSDWGTIVLVALVLYGLLFVYLMVTGHADVSGTCDNNQILCGDRREKEKKFVLFGGAGSMSFGAVIFLFYLYSQEPWLLFLSKVQLVMSVVDVLYIYVQFIFNPGEEKLELHSHGLSLRAPGCARTSVWDPIGLGLYLLQILTNWKWLAWPRGLLQFVLYDLIGTPIAMLIFLPARLLGKKVTVLPA